MRTGGVLLPGIGEVTFPLLSFLRKIWRGFVLNVERMVLLRDVYLVLTVLIVYVQFLLIVFSFIT